MLNDFLIFYLLRSL